MNVLQRRMFANGGAVGISPELNDYLQEIGVDPTGKSPDQIKKEVDQKLQGEYADYSKLIFDPSDPLDYLSAGLMATGVGGLVAGPFKALRTGRKGQKIVEQLNKQRERAAKIFKENPITSTALAGGAAVPIIDSITDFEGQPPSTTPPDIITEELSSLSNEEKQKQADRTAESSEKQRLENEAAAAKKKKDEINETLKILQTRSGEFNEAEKERISQERRDNAFTLMQEIGSSMVETGQIDRGLAEGATKAAKRISDEKLAEKLAEDELKKKMAEEGKISATEKNKIVTTYADAQLHLTNMDFISNELDKMIGLVKSGAVTGGKGLLGRTLGKIKGFVGFGDEQIADATLAKQIGTFVRTQLVRELLNESGRTISNLDRQLIDEIVGDVADLGEGRGAILKSLERIRQRIGSSSSKSRNTVEFYKAEYGAQVPNLSIFDQQERYTPPTETEVSVTADDVIQ